jgi:hypothetical protein
VNLSLEKLPPEKWAELSKSAHLATFGTDRDPAQDRINYALLVHNQEAPCSYSTIIELDSKSAYMQHGGAFPNVAKSVWTVKSYVLMTNYLKERYETVSTKIFHKNTAMLKLAMAAGLSVSGLEVVDGHDIFLILSWRKNDSGGEEC